MSTKTELRRRLRAARTRLDAAEQARRADQIAAVLQAHIRPTAVVAAYRPMTGEPDVGPFLTAHLARGGTVLLPRVVPGPARRMEWIPWTPETTMRRSRQLPLDEPAGEPAALEVPRDVDVMLVPALAVGRDGVRLGQGGGYYDRLLGPGPETGEDTVDAGPAGIDAEPEGADPEGAAGPERIAVVHPEELLSAGDIPVEPHDLRVARAITAQGPVRLDLTG
ncbi:5-formyltetrahydrofolate cyclo-ligase [Nesterenkonia halophila]|uniref:5-formyltetrahydrofolate cyclo-ligase n=1 Tax=Nesterenkonia halophila TaxID=302044 RepID=UPI0012910D3E|nr:5-formyltetrahydrofolate cyclo-ligase [Nesterenkonia halophila]